MARGELVRRPGRLLSRFRQVPLDTLAFVHTRQIAHRGLKPKNILIDSSGKPKPIDFGVGREGTVRRGSEAHADYVNLALALSLRRSRGTSERTHYCRSVPERPSTAPSRLHISRAVLPVLAIWWRASFAYRSVILMFAWPRILASS